MDEKMDQSSSQVKKVFKKKACRYEAFVVKGVKMVGHTCLWRHVFGACKATTPK